MTLIYQMQVEGRQGRACKFPGSNVRGIGGYTIVLLHFNIYKNGILPFGTLLFGVG